MNHKERATCNAATDADAVRELATAADAEALASGSLVAVFSSDTDECPDVLLRYGTGWTEMLPGWSGTEGIPSDSVPGMGHRVVVLWDGGADHRGRLDAMEQATLAGSDLDSLPYGTLVRAVRPWANPHWPNVLRRVRGGFEGLNPDQDAADMIPTGAAALYYGDLTVVWVPAATKETS